ncbi:MAG: amidase [Gammaproteobacteria bacterium]|nr:MAG: amidase [Pseudomonadota bacterium]PIE38788.1 MAG: amidase [Gammaproteobacteria bacterium]
MTHTLFTETADKTRQKQIHAFSDDALGKYDAVELSKLLKTGQVSAKELVTSAIDRAVRVNPSLSAIAAECYSYALINADRFAAQSTGFFAGIPTFIKDNTPLSGVATQHGSDAIRARPAKQNGIYTRQFLSGGFVALGKSTLPEFGFNATTEPGHCAPTRNPWHTDYSSGASSGGSAALVATGVVPVAHANDGGGSIRIPAACCGLVGLKPSRNRHMVSEQAKKLPINLVGEGIVSRSVRDTAYFHYEMEKYFLNPNLPPLKLVTGPGKKRLRIGLVCDSITGYATDQTTRNVVENIADILSDAGHQVELAQLPIDYSFIEDFALYWASLAFSTVKWGKSVMDPSFQPDKVDSLTKGLAKLFRRNFYKMPFFLHRLRRTGKQCAEFHQNYDLLLSPTLAHTTPRLGYISPDVPFEELFDRLMRYVSFTPLANASGCPAISIPAGMSDNHMPVSVQLSATHGNENRLLEVAYELEQLNPWPLHPGIVHN